MSHYTNPAFCQKSEFYPQEISSNEFKNFKRSTQSELSVKDALVFQAQNLEIGAHKNQQQQQQTNQRKLPPKPGPKAIKFNINTEYSANAAFCNNPNPEAKTQHANGYALVPINELPTASKDRYAILPASQAHMLHSNSLRLSKSQDNLDFDFTESAYEEEDSFTSLPVFSTQVDNRKLIPAFSSDFINHTFGSSEQNGMQRYAIVPTDDDEDLVDSNHEIIEMCNGRAHRYAVIPADDNDICRPVEYDFRRGKLNKSQSFVVGPEHKKIIRRDTPIKSNENAYSCTTMNRQAKFNIKPQSSMLSTHPMKEMPNTPTKNLNATQKLHELLSTPRKDDSERLQRYGSYQTIIQRSPNQIQLHQLNPPQNRPEFVPQKLNYENRTTLAQNIEHRTTAIISPRLQQQMAFDETNDKQWSHESFQKVENATAKIGIVSLMLILTGILNSGLCLYMVYKMRRSFYLDVGIISGFAEVVLGAMGFKTRQCYWLPNRHYIRGNVIVTVLSLANCCGLLVLLWLDPYPGTPYHGLIAGIIMGLSSLILLLISLGVISSKWCFAPPPDNHVDVF